MSVIALAAIPLHAENRIIAVIDAQEYTESELRAHFDPTHTGQDIPIEAQYAEMLEQFLLETLIYRAALDAEYDSDPRVEEYIKRLGARYLARLYLEDRIDQEIDDAALVEAYAERMRTQEPVEEIRARHILLDSAEAARVMIAELDEGANFAELAKEHSKGPSAVQGGDLGYFTRGRMVLAFEEVAFALEEGRYSTEPVPTQFGFHVIVLEDIRERPQPGFEEMRDELLAEMQGERVREILAELKVGADIRRFDLEGSPLEEPVQ